MGRAPTGSMRKLSSGRWQVRYTGPDGVRRSAPRTFQTKRDAHSYLAQVTADISRGEWRESGHEASVAVSFRDYTSAWLDSRKVKGRGLSDRTRGNYQDLLDRFILPTFGPQALHTISREQVDRWYDRTAVGAPVSRSRAYSLLRSILNTAVEDEHLPRNPARIRGAGRAERTHQVRPATIQELQVLTEAMPPAYRLMVQFAAFCALRFGEVTELRRADVDTKNGVLRIRRAVVRVNEQFVVKAPKSGAGVRDVHIPEALMPAVRQHLLEHTAPGSDGLLFPGKRDVSQHLHAAVMAKMYYPAREAAGRADLRFHDLRHTGAVLAAQTGATLAELMARLGHSSPQAALRYQHAADGRDAVIAHRLSDMITGSAG